MTQSTTDNSTMELSVVVMIVVGILLYKYFKDIDIVSVEIMLYWFIFYIIVGILSIASAVFLVVKTARFIESKRDEKTRAYNRVRCYIDELDVPYTMFGQSTAERKSLRQLRRKHHGEEYAQLFKEARENVDIKEQKFFTAYDEERARQQRIQIKKEQAKVLLEHFLKVNSEDGLPEWALNHSRDVIEHAQKQYRAIEEENKKRKHQQEEAVEFVLEHNAYPTDYAEMDAERQGFYKEALRLYAKGELKVPEHKRDYSIASHWLRGSIFYHADRLTPEQRDELINSGYRYVPFIDLNGKPGNNLIIKNSGKRESDYHLCLKLLFGELENSHTERMFSNLRVDVVFEFGKKKYALEIETGKNKQTLVREKIHILNTHFDQWIFVCSRTNKKKYRKFVDGKKSHCMTVKEAYDKLRALAAAEGAILQ